FPFLVKGSASARFHIVNKTDHQLHTPESHRHSQVHFKADQPLTLLGFYSEQAQGIFTHHDSHLHVHLTTDDNQRSGHVEAVELKPGMRLLLPKN
ncbi:MAG: alpha-acetolactate decarboxylase, partial [Ferruginibacter sp.]|nr:alpha-acetolactate decarboxylase [Cytophagales bacterium]